MKNILIVSLVLLAAAYSVALASVATGTLSTEGVVIVSPTANPAPGTYTSAQSVALTAAGASSIRFTTNGSTPDCTSAGTVYTSAIPVSSSLTIKAIACYPGPSSVVSFAYAINIAASNTTTGNGSGGSSGGGGGGGGSQVAGASTGRADINHDGRVDVLDFNVLIVNWGGSPSNANADLNGDGRVDILDFNMLIVGWSR